MKLVITMLSFILMSHLCCTISEAAGIPIGKFQDNLYGNPLTSANNLLDQTKLSFGGRPITLWQQLESSLKMRPNEASLERNKRDFIRLLKQLYDLHIVVKKASANSLIPATATTTARPTYDQIPRPILLDEEFETMDFQNTTSALS